MDSLEAKAIYFLSRREYAYHELFTKLKKYTADEVLIKKVLDKLEVKGYLCDKRFIESCVLSQSRKYGLLKIKHILNQKTAKPKLVNELLAQMHIDEAKSAHQLITKKFGAIAKDKTLLAQQIRFLMHKGFSSSIIRRLLRNIDYEE